LQQGYHRVLVICRQKGKTEIPGRKLLEAGLFINRFLYAGFPESKYEFGAIFVGTIQLLLSRFLIIQTNF
jgi:hypothetical protein